MNSKKRNKRKKKNNTKKVNWRNKRKNFLIVLGNIGIILAIFGTNIMDIYDSTKKIPFIRKQYYEKKVEEVVVDSNKEFIDGLLGIPKLIKEINFNDDNGIINIKRCDYFLKDFIATMYYFEDDSLLGYSIINLEENFNPEIPFRNQHLAKYNSKPLGKEGLNQYIETPQYISYSYGVRNDTSNYYMEFQYHHLGTANQIIGYGYSELVEKSTEKIEYFRDNIIRLSKKLDGVKIKPNFYIKKNHDESKNFTSIYDDLIKDSLYIDFRKTIKPNCVLIINASDNHKYNWNIDTAYRFLENELNLKYIFTNSDFRKLK